MHNTARMIPLRYAPTLRLTIIITCLIIFITGLSAQSVYEKSDTLKFTFKFQPYQKTTNNKVLNQLALAQLKIPEKTTFTLQYSYRLSIGFSNDDQLHMFLDITPLDVEGQTQLRDFNLKPLLQPSAFMISYALLDPDGQILLQSKEMVITDGGIVRLTSFPDSLWRNGTSAVLEVQDVQFTEADFRRLELELFAIRDYYAAASLSDTLTRRIQKERKEIPTFNDAVITWITGTKSMYLLNGALDVNSAMVPGADPKRLAPKRSIAAYSLQEYLNYCTNERQVPLAGDLYLSFADAYMQSLVYAELLSRNVDYYSSPFFYRLYTNSFSSSQIIQAHAFIQKQIKDRKYGNADERILMQRLLQAYIKRSRELTATGKYLEAVDLLTGAANILSIAPTAVGIHTTLQAELDKARSGLIYSYTEIIQKALDKGLTTLADKYLAEVTSFTDKYNLSNKADGPFRMFYIRLADIKIQYGHKFLEKNDPGAALTEFTNALELLSQYEGTVVERATNGQSIAVRTLYNRYLGEVKDAITQNDYSSATAKLQYAEQFAASYPAFYPDKEMIGQLQSDIAMIRYNYLTDRLKNRQGEVSLTDIEGLAECYRLLLVIGSEDSDDLDSLTFTLGMPYVMNLFSHARLKYWASEPDSALFYSNRAYDLAVKLKFNNLETVKEQFGNIQALAGETYCNQAKGDFHSLLNQAEAFFKENKFSSGLLKTAAARELVYLKSNCDLTTQPINQLLNKYEHPIRWDNLVNEAFDKLGQGNYREASNLIWQAESLHAYYRLDTIGVSNIGYYDLAMQSEDTLMVRHAISNELSKGNPDKAFNLLNKLRLLGYSAAESNDLQETLARVLAQRDIAETPDLNIKVMLQNYTGGNKWFARFESVYRYYTRSK